MYGCHISLFSFLHLHHWGDTNILHLRSNSSFTTTVHHRVSRRGVLIPISQMRACLGSPSQGSNLILESKSSIIYLKRPVASGHTSAHWPLTVSESNPYKLANTCIKYYSLGRWERMEMPILFIYLIFLVCNPVFIPENRILISYKIFRVYLWLLIKWLM